MKDRPLDCQQALRILRLGEPGADDHLSRCAACRREAGRIESVLRALLRQPDVGIPAGLDRSIRAALAGRADGRLRPMILLPLSAAASVALVLGMAGILIELHPASVAIWRGLFVGLAYAAITSVATLPLVGRGARALTEDR